MASKPMKGARVPLLTIKGEPMNVLSLILFYGAATSLAASLILLAMGLVNPRLMYPKDIQAAVPPKNPSEKRQTLYWGIPFWICLLGFPLIAALRAVTLRGLKLSAQSVSIDEEVSRNTS